MKLQAYPIPQFPSSPAPQPLSPLNPPAPQPLSPLNPLSPSIPQPLNPPALNPPALQSPSPQAFQRSVRLKYFTYKKKTVIGENATSRPAAKHFPRSRFFFICRARARGGGGFPFFCSSTFFLQTHVHPLPRSELSARMQGGPPPLGAWVLTFAGKLLDRNLAVRVQSGSTFNLSCGRETPLLTSKWLKSGPGGGREAITI